MTKDSYSYSKYNSFNFVEAGCSLNYKIKLHSIEKKVLKIDVSVNIKNHNNVLKLFKGNLKYFNFTSDRNFKEEGDFVYIQCSPVDSFIFSYQVKVGGFGKHGLAGDLYSDLLAYSGEQTLLLPVEAYYIKDKNEDKFIKELIIEYDFPLEWNCVIPFESQSVASAGRTFSVVNFPGWPDFYNLMKSCYAFGNMKYYNSEELDGKLKVYIDPQYGYIFNEDIFQAILSLYNYYSDLFEYKMESLSLVFLRKNSLDDFYIMGGCGRQVIGATFNPDKLRDWQLLAHRMFHAFMDSKIPKPEFHIPPNVWVTEGLTTYYEIAALESLPAELKRKLEISSEKEFASLFRKYLYMRLKDPKLFSIIPMSEKNIKSNGQLEFLHYTQAPLIIKFMEDYICVKEGSSDKLIKYLINNNVSLDLEKFFRYALGSQTDAFAAQFLFDSQVLPLWHLSKGTEENVDKVLHELNDFEYTLWSWFIKEDPSYSAVSLTDRSLLQSVDNDRSYNVHFSSPSVEENTKAFSPTVYSILKKRLL